MLMRKSLLLLAAAALVPACSETLDKTRDQHAGDGSSSHLSHMTAGIWGRSPGLRALDHRRWSRRLC